MCFLDLLFQHDYTEPKVPFRSVSLSKLNVLCFYDKIVYENQTRCSQDKDVCFKPYKTTSLHIPPWAPWMTLTVPSGNPASCSSFMSSIHVPGSRSDGFITIVLPVMRAVGNIYNHTGNGPLSVIFTTEKHSCEEPAFADHCCQYCVILEHKFSGNCVLLITCLQAHRQILL